MFYEWFFRLGDDGEIDTTKFLRDSNELANFIDKKFDIYDIHPSIYYTGNIYGYFRIYKQVKKSDHGRCANEFNIFQEYKGTNCYILSGNVCFLKFTSTIFSSLAWNVSNSYNHKKEEQML